MNGQQLTPRLSLQANYIMAQKPLQKLELKTGQNVPLHSKQNTKKDWSRLRRKNTATMCQSGNWSNILSGYLERKRRTNWMQ